AERRARLRQQPGRAHVAVADVSGQPAVEDLEMREQPRKHESTKKNPAGLLRVFVISWLLFHGAAAIATPAVTLTVKDIDDAIQWGTWGEPPPAPYLLHNPSPEPGRINPGIIAAIYTPFVRVALTAKTARDAGRRFTS